MVFQTEFTMTLNRFILLRGNSPGSNAQQPWITAGVMVKAKLKCNAIRQKVMQLLEIGRDFNKTAKGVKQIEKSATRYY